MKQLQLGYDAHIATSQAKDPKEISISGSPHRTLPWSETLEKDTVNIIHTDIPPILSKLPNRVFMTHGSPYYTYIDDYIRSDGSMGVAATLLDTCDLIVTSNPKHAQYWSELTDPEKIHVVRGGVDLDVYTPIGDKITFTHHPSILYCDAMRIAIKEPYTLLYAMKKVARELSSSRLQLINIPQEKQGFWHYMVGRLKLDAAVENIGIGLHPKPRILYRSVDMLIHPVRGGAISSVGCEALACGCPTIILRGEDYSVATAKCKDEPDLMAEAILKLWDRIQREGAEAVREEARKIAEKHYDITRTARELLQLCSDYFQIPMPQPQTSTAEKRVMDAYWTQTPQNFGYDEQRMTVMAKHGKGNVLDLGCGKGPYAHMLHAPVGLDLSLAALKEYPGEKVLGDGVHMPFRDGAFDTVLASEYFEHIANIQAAVNEAKRVLRPDGLIVGSVPNHARDEWHRDDWQSKTHRQKFTPRMIEEVFSKPIDFHVYTSQPASKELRLLFTVKKLSNPTASALQP